MHTSGHGSPSSLDPLKSVDPPYEDSLGIVPGHRFAAAEPAPCACECPACCSPLPWSCSCSCSMASEWRLKRLFAGSRWYSGRWIAADRRSVLRAA